MKSPDRDKGFVCEFASPDGGETVVIEDDGEVCYAYILNDRGAISGDVWLYNRCPTPVGPEWHNRENLPFANPASFVNQNSTFRPPAHANEFAVEWDDADGVSIAKVFLNQTYFAELMIGSRPGWSLLASKDGPLAQVLRARGAAC
jgi:hypothetical protein